MSDQAIAVTIVTGFLGAGKSTLLERWLGELPREDTAVIVNEQGEVGIDGALLRSRVSRLREITGGCVCCATQAALDAALSDFANLETPPTRILIETSGAASPAGVIRPLTWGSAREHLRLDGVVAVLHADCAEEVLQYPLAVEQLAFSDLVVLSHADLCDGATLKHAETLAASHAPGAFVAKSSAGTLREVDGLLALLDARGTTLRTLSSDTPATTRHGFDSVSMCWEGEVDEDAFIDWVERELGAIEARIVRLKGILAIAGLDARVIVHGVGATMNIELGAAWEDTPREGRLVIIGLALDAEALLRSFEEATGARLNA